MRFIFFVFSGIYLSIVLSPICANQITINQESKLNTAEMDICIQVFDKKLIKNLNISIIKIPFGLEKFKMVGLENGKYIVSGAINLRPKIYLFNSKWKNLWIFEDSSIDPSVGTDIVAINNSCFLVSSVIEWIDKERYKRKIRVIKFHPSE